MSPRKRNELLFSAWVLLCLIFFLGPPLILMFQGCLEQWRAVLQ